MVPDKKTLITTMECHREYSSECYFSCGETKIVEGRAGRYREAEGKPLSRFGYRFSVKNIGRPHLAIIRYPDDKRRFMIINDGTTYDLSTGITTGHAYPISGEMKEMHQVFWPRWRDCSLCFMTWGYNEPAAVEKIEIYELDELPSVDIPNTPGCRELGIQYEDPCGTGLAEGATTFEQWLDHVVDYAKHTGQTLLAYPICWYHGPWYPSKSERADTFSIVAASDRKLYVAWTDEPEDWPAILLERFEKEGLSFQGALTLLRLSSLMEKMNIDLPSIQAGAETINNMLWNNQVQATTGDWTITYNTKNYPSLLNQPDPLNGRKDFNWAYGEKWGEPYHAGPMFNPLHPVVQGTIIGFIREAAQRYSRFSSFKGLSINIWPPTLVWFGSLRTGYDDYTISLFEQETGVKIPVDAQAPNRFADRYNYLIFVASKVWIAWRCRKIHQFIRAIRDAVVHVRSDLRLTLTLWCETTVACIYGNGGPEHQIHARNSMLEILRQGGIDPELYCNEPNIELDYQMEGGGRDRTTSCEETSQIERFFMFRDHDFLDENLLQAMANTSKSGIFILNAWHEAWGTHKWFLCEPNDKNVLNISTTYGQHENVHVFRLNSEYPKDGFWWDSQLRITAAYPPPPHFMEQYAHAVAEMDARRITRGGLFLDKAHSEEIQMFAKAYCALPVEKFETVGISTDPVTVRTLVKDGVRYLYFVNREYYSIDVEVRIDQFASSVIDLATHQKVDVRTPWKFRLGPYELRSFSLQPQTMIQDFSIYPPETVICGLIEESQKALDLIRQVQAKEFFLVGLDEVASEIESALQQHRWARLRHLLTSYPVCKCKQILS